MPPTIFPTGVTIYDPETAYNCFVSYDGRDGHAYLIDMNGNEPKVWPYCAMPSEIIDPAVIGGQRGHAILQKERHSFGNKTLLELDWDENVV
ncbi:MAG: ArsR family transcriptional regulator, partial [Rhodospirillaceae bacterium]|nr:ArsR family transcriptional regulator [Rhodospirillaceae bacterium]